MLEIVAGGMDYFQVGLNADWKLEEKEGAVWWAR